MNHGDDHRGNNTENDERKKEAKEKWYVEGCWNEKRDSRDRKGEKISGIMGEKRGNGDT